MNLGQSEANGNCPRTRDAMKCKVVVQRVMTQATHAEHLVVWRLVNGMKDV